MGKFLASLDQIESARLKLRRAITSIYEAERSLDDLRAALRQDGLTKGSVELQDEFGLFSLAELEDRHIERMLDYVGGNKMRAARILGVNVKTLYNRLRGKSFSTRKRLECSGLS
jgi:DNA-binding protein Fis